MSKFDETKERLERSYNPECDLFDDPVQMNYVDKRYKRLLDLIVMLDERLARLTRTVESLEAEIQSYHGY